MAVLLAAIYAWMARQESARRMSECGRDWTGAKAAGSLAGGVSWARRTAGSAGGRGISQPGSLAASAASENTP
jgi:hypothetical protein